MAKCKDSGVNQNGDCTPNFKNPNSILNSILCLFKIPTKIGINSMPKDVTLGSITRCADGGLNASKVASRIIRRQSEAGIPVGPLPSGEISPDEIMERIRVEEIISAITTEMVLDVAIQPGSNVNSTVASPVGPLPATGIVTTIAKGQAIVNPCV
jgi:hypothetical protein